MKSRSYYYDNAGYGVSSPDTKLVRHSTKINVFKVNFTQLEQGKKSYTHLTTFFMST